MTIIINFLIHNIISHSVGVVFNIVLQCNTVNNMSDCVLFLFFPLIEHFLKNIAMLVKHSVETRLK